MSKTLIEKIHDIPLEEIMGDRFGKYSKYIIQDRALPDVRDGLKPVQRRILFSMYKDKNTYDRETKKSAKTVGAVIGNYHPHGDTSVYDAMVRMSQNWKMREVLIEMQGNNGSIDGDGPAAMRYTEARLSKISNLLLQDLEKKCVLMAPTFDDATFEPTVLPAHFPNLLVNGSTGISAGYATNIPPHNLAEVIDGTILRLENPDCTLEDVMQYIKGPDFSTGGIIEGKKDIVEAYRTGKGKVIVKCKYEIIKEKNNHQIIITEIPFDVIKSNIIKKIEEIRLNKQVDGILEVRDESDKNDNLRIAIDLKKDANSFLIMNYILKNTEAQINYSFNMVAIVNRRPKVLGLLEIIDAFIAHKTEVVTLRTKYDLENYKARLHIVEGFIKALSILDEVIKTIRKSKNKTDAKENLVKEFNFTMMQADAIVMMQLYKLTNTDVTDLENEYKELTKMIDLLTKILENKSALKRVIKNELNVIKRDFMNPRKTEIKDEITEIKIEKKDMVSKEDYVVIVSSSGYIKKISLKSYASSEGQETGLKEFDYVEGIYKINNLSTIIMFTNLGNYLYVPVSEISEFKYKDIGMHVSNIVKISDGEKIIRSIAVSDFNTENYITAFTKNGMVKRMLLNNFVSQRYSRPIQMFKLKENDELLSISKINDDNVFVITKNGFALRFKTEEIPVVGLKTTGVKLIKLVQDEVKSAFVSKTDNEFITIFTLDNTAKRIKIDQVPITNRGKKGIMVVKPTKLKKYNILKAFNLSSKSLLGILTTDINEIKNSDIPIFDRLSNGTIISKKDILDVFKVQKIKDVRILKKEEIVKPEARQINLNDIIDDFKI